MTEEAKLDYLKSLRECPGEPQITKRHDDGDLTVSYCGKEYVLTEDKVFEEIVAEDIEKLTLGEICGLRGGRPLPSCLVFKKRKCP